MVFAEDEESLFFVFAQTCFVFGFGNAHEHFEELESDHAVLGDHRVVFNACARIDSDKESVGIGDLKIFVEKLKVIAERNNLVHSNAKRFSCRSSSCLMGQERRMNVAW